MTISKSRWLKGFVTTIVVGALIALIIYHGFGIGKSQQEISATQQETPDTPQETSEPLIITSKLIPSDIKEYIDSLPPDEGESVIQTYKGIEVTWPVKLLDLYEYGVNPGIYRIYATHINDSEQLDSAVILVCEIDIEDYPVLKTASEGLGFIIQGTIYEIEPWIIELDNCHLYFD